MRTEWIRELLSSLGETLVTYGALNEVQLGQRVVLGDTTR